MTWQGFFSGAGNVARVSALIILKIIIFFINLIFMAIKFVLFLTLVVFTLGKFGADSVSFGRR